MEEESVSTDQVSQTQVPLLDIAAAQLTLSRKLHTDRSHISLFRPKTLEAEILLTRPEHGPDPLRKMLKKQSGLCGFPFEPQQLKSRHKKILKSLDHRFQQKNAVKELESEDCESIDSDAYLIGTDKNKVTTEEIEAETLIGKKIMLEVEMLKQKNHERKKEKEAQKLAKKRMDSIQPIPPFEELIVNDLPKKLRISRPIRSKVKTGLREEYGSVEKQPVNQDEDVIEIVGSRNFEDNNSAKFVSETRLKKLSDEINQRYGLKNAKMLRSINPKMLQEADRPSILFQHIDYKLRAQLCHAAKEDPKVFIRINNYDFSQTERPHMNPTDKEVDKSCDMLKLQDIMTSNSQNFLIEKDNGTGPKENLASRLRRDLAFARRQKFVPKKQGNTLSEKIMQRKLKEHEEQVETKFKRELVQLQSNRVNEQSNPQYARRHDTSYSNRSSHKKLYDPIRSQIDFSFKSNVDHRNVHQYSHQRLHHYHQHSFQEKNQEVSLSQSKSEMLTKDFNKLAMIKGLLDSESSQMQISQTDQDQQIIVNSFKQIWNELETRSYQKKQSLQSPKSQNAQNLNFDKKFKETVNQVSDAFGGVPKTASNNDLRAIHWQTSKQQKLKETQFTSVIPAQQAIADSIKNFNNNSIQTPKTHSITQIDSAKLDWTMKLINQMLMSIKDDFIRSRYYSFIKENNIEIVSDIFERMDTDRRLKDEKTKLQKECEKKGTYFDLAAYLKDKKTIYKLGSKEDINTKKNHQQIQDTDAEVLSELQTEDIGQQLETRTDVEGVEDESQNEAD